MSTDGTCPPVQEPRGVFDGAAWRVWLTGPSLRRPKRDGQGMGKYDVAISSQHGILNNHVRETSPHQVPGGREGVSIPDSAEDELFVDESMTTTSLAFSGRATPKYTIPLGLGFFSPVSRYSTQVCRHSGPGSLLRFFRDVQPVIAGYQVLKLHNGHKLSQRFSRRRWFRRFHMSQTANGSRDDTTLFCRLTRDVFCCEACASSKRMYPQGSSARRVSYSLFLIPRFLGFNIL